jgi:hypothetical protein
MHAMGYSGRHEFYVGRWGDSLTIHANGYGDEKPVYGCYTRLLITDKDSAMCTAVLGCSLQFNNT